MEQKKRLLSPDGTFSECLNAWLLYTATRVSAMSGDITSVSYVSEDSLVDLSYLDDDELNDELVGTLSEMSDKDDSFLVSDEDIFEEDDKQDCNKPR